MLRPISVPAYPTAARRPLAAGVGLKPEHAPAIFADARGVGFFEVHAENYMGDGGPPHRLLAAIRERFPLSLHGVGLSIGGAAPLDRGHLARLQHLVALYRPGLFSEHLAWSSHNGVYFNDLLPVAYDEATLARVTAHIDQVQNMLGVRMLLENPSAYVALDGASMGEIEFLAEVVRRTGCGLLLDVNNVHVSAVNLGFDAFDYLARFPAASVGEIHLAGFAEDADADGSRLLIDAHNAPVADPVWALYEYAVQRTRPVPTLIEWDNTVPTFEVLAREAGRANAIADRVAAATFLRSA